MIRRVLTPFISIALVLFSVSGAQARQQPVAPSAQKSISIPGDLARALPSDAAVVGVVSDVGAAVDLLGGDAAIGSMLDAVGVGLPTGAQPLRLSGADLRALRGSSFAACALGTSLASSTAAILRPPSREAAEELRDRVLVPALVAVGGGAPRVLTVRGLRSIELPVGGATVQVVTVGDALVVGDAGAVGRILDAASGATPSIADEAGYLKAQAALGADAEPVSFYASGKSTAGAGLLAFFGEMPAPIRTLVGADAILGAAAASRAGRDGVVARFDLFVDGEKPGLVPVLATPPPLLLASADLVPENARSYTAGSLDVARLFDTMNSLNPEELRGAHIPPFQDYVREAETAFGLKLRDQIIPALGSELAYASLPPVVPEDSEAYSGPSDVVFLEVRDAGAVREIIPKLLSTSGVPPTVEEADGVTTFTTFSFSIALAPPFVIVGERPDVRRCIEARASGKVLSRDTAFSAARGRWTGDLLYVSYKALLPGAPKSEESSAPLELFLLGGSSRAVFRVEGGVETQAEISYAQMSDAFARIVDRVRTRQERVRRASNEEAAGRVLRDIVAAETRALAASGRYASSEDLAAAGDLAPETTAALRGEAGPYRYALVLRPGRAKKLPGFNATANPTSYGSLAQISFSVDEKGVVQSSDATAAPAAAIEGPPDVDEP